LEQKKNGNKEAGNIKKKEETAIRKNTTATTATEAETERQEE
jgi:hypothetical protein